MTGNISLTCLFYAKANPFFSELKKGKVTSDVEKHPFNELATSSRPLHGELFYHLFFLFKKCLLGSLSLTLRRKFHEQIANDNYL